MANPTGNPESLTAPRFEPGKSGNPGGKPASRSKLTTAFLNALAADFDQHGKTAIEKCRTEKPEAYVKVIAALCPKELELKTPLQDATEDELRTLLAALRAARGADNEGVGAAHCPAPTH